MLHPPDPQEGTLVPIGVETGCRTATNIFGDEKISFDWACSLVAVLTVLLWLLLMNARTTWNKISTYLEYIHYHFWPSQSLLWVCIYL